jgi:hypothetical protein
MSLALEILKTLTTDELARLQCPHLCSEIPSPLDAEAALLIKLRLAEKQNDGVFITDLGHEVRSLSSKCTCLQPALKAK